MKKLPLIQRFNEEIDAASIISKSQKAVEKGLPFKERRQSDFRITSQREKDYGLAEISKP